MKPKTRCRHERNARLVEMTHGGIQWCWRCGAYRIVCIRFSLLADYRYRKEIKPKSMWVRPVGENGRFPWPRYVISETKWMIRNPSPKWIEVKT